VGFQKSMHHLKRLDRGHGQRQWQVAGGGYKKYMHPTWGLTSEGRGSQKFLYLT
jgi:hypothetical protein